MTRPRCSVTLLGMAAASALALAGCAGIPDASGNDHAKTRLTVVASTNVYAQIAEEVGGDLVEVTAIISSDSQDPHSFEPSARDQLTVSRADLIIENGGGYDSFIDALIESSGAAAHVITASVFSHDWPENTGHAGDEHAGDGHADDGHAEHEHVEGFNEHVWYDPHTMAYVAEAIAEELSELSPDDAETFTDNAEAFHEAIEGLEDSLAELAAAHEGDRVFVTEPLSGYLVREAGLENVTPDAFSEAVEEGQDVAPATLLEALGLIESGGVGLVITNRQTGGAETTQIVDDAENRGIPVIAFSETLPEGQTYISWMQANIKMLRAALDE